ncbi:uncharacterized protein LOC108949594 [Ciona intestinalis]
MPSSNSSRLPIIYDLLIGWHLVCDCLRNQGVCMKDGVRLIGRYTTAMKCNGFNDCGDWSDEKDCFSECGKKNLSDACFQRVCDCQRDHGVCMKNGIRLRGHYSNWMKCDGFNDCGDWSDENDCVSECDTVNHTPCDCIFNETCDRKDRVYFWPCYQSFYACDGENYCGDWSDERGCNFTCGRDEFQCDCDKNGQECPIDSDYISHCYKQSDICDGYPLCTDWSDEKNCTCEPGQLKCGCMLNSTNCTSNLGCVDVNYLLDGNGRCEDKSDEACQIKCVKYAKTLSQGYDTYDTICGEVFHCRNETELEYLKALNRTVKRDLNCIPVQSYSSVNQTYLDPEWWCIEDYYAKVGLQQCEDKGFVIAPNFCNGKADCGDGSDEMYDVPGFKCRAKSEYFQLKQSCVLPQVNLYNNNSYCEDGSDNCFVDGKLKCFRCLDGKLMISGKQVCDGVIDCYDLSDECLCQDQTLCDDVLGHFRKSCHSNEIICNGVCMKTSEVVCNNSIYCNDSLNNKFCMKSKMDQRKGSGHIVCSVDKNNRIYKNATMCDGIPECYNREDECDVGCTNQTHFCDVDVNCHKLKLTPVWENSGVISLSAREYCDGRPAVDEHGASRVCGFGFDEVNCTERFYCTSSTKDAVSIKQDLVCDGVHDCKDGSDELESLCQYSRFYCLSKQPLSVERSRVENGFKDCSDGSDECPANSNKTSVFSSPFEMIGSPVFRAFFWVMGIVCLVGNGGVFLHTVLSLLKSDVTPIKASLHWFLLNLSISDFLMGVYLVAISSKGVEYSGRYCYHDAEWRSSNLCSGFGSLTIISSEVSALTMAVMATFRLIAVYEPFKMTHVKWVTFVMPTVAAWIVGILLGILPLQTFNSGYFVASVWFPNYFYSKQVISKQEMYLLYNNITRLTDGTPSMLQNWADVKQKIAETFRELEMKAEFGYFGETSVCMPKLFSHVGSEAWEYSTALISINFFLFIYMVACYLFMYKRSTKMKFDAQRSNKLQKTISLLILTNFCCWIPICIMAFVSLSGVQLDRIVYVISAGVLLPINSVINPIIYSDIVMIVVRKITTTKKPKFNL